MLSLRADGSGIAFVRGSGVGSSTATSSRSSSGSSNAGAVPVEVAPSPLGSGSATPPDNLLHPVDNLLRLNGDAEGDGAGDTATLSAVPQLKVRNWVTVWGEDRARPLIRVGAEAGDVEGSLTAPASASAPPPTGSSSSLLQTTLIGDGASSAAAPAADDLLGLF